MNQRLQTLLYNYRPNEKPLFAALPYQNVIETFKNQIDNILQETTIFRNVTFVLHSTPLIHVLEKVKLLHKKREDYCSRKLRARSLVLATCCRKPKAPGSNPAASYMQRCARCSNYPAHVYEYVM